MNNLALKLEVETNIELELMRDILFSEFEKYIINILKQSPIITIEEYEYDSTISKYNMVAGTVCEDIEFKAINDTYYLNDFEIEKADVMDIEVDDMCNIITIHLIGGVVVVSFE